MKTPAAIKITTSACRHSSANSTGVGQFPKRVNTVIAQTLADLLAGLRLTGMDSVFDASTTRLAHHIHALGKVHGWHVETFEKVVGTNDGRVQTIVEYFLSPEVIEQAAVQGAQEWVAQVRVARAARRRKAAEARRAAERANAARKTRAHPGQRGLFDLGACQ